MKILFLEHVTIGRREVEVALKILENDENQLPNIKNQVQEYIGELDLEIKRCMSWQNDNFDKIGSLNFEKIISRINTLQEVRRDLKSKLDELV